MLISVKSLQMSPVISEGNGLYTHHMLVYLCPLLSDEEVGTSSVCDFASNNVQAGRGETLFGAWAVGGTVSRHTLLGCYYSTTKCHMSVIYYSVN